MLGSPHPSAAACSPALPSHSSPRARLHSRARRARAPPGAAAGGARTAVPQARAPVANARARARAARGGRQRPRSADDPGAPRARTGSRCRAPAPPCSAASSQRPPQNSSHERPQNARALRGSSRSRHSSSSRSNNARASSLLDDGAKVFTTRERRLLDELRSADRRRRSRAAGMGSGGASCVADHPAEDRLHRLGARPKDVVVELVGELERHPGVLERPYVALPEARCPREPAMDDRLKRRTRACLLESLLEQGDRAIDALELGEEDERLGAQRPDLGLGQQVGRDRPRPRPFTRR